MTVDNEIDSGKAFDWENTSSDYAKYRDIYPDEFYERIKALNLCVEGQKVLDLGTGTGVLPRNMYKYKASFIGVDASENQICEARRLSIEAGMDIEYITAPAEDVVFPEESFDVVTACQSFMYFDRSIVIPKVHSILKNYGHFLILNMAWLPEESEIAKKSEEMVLKYNPSWTGGGMKRYTLNESDWSNKLFICEHIITFDISVPFTRETWHGRMKTCRGIGASLKASEISHWEKEHIAFLDTVPEIFNILHYASLIVLRKV